MFIYYQDRFDKWLDEGSPQLRFIGNEDVISNGTLPAKVTPPKSAGCKIKFAFFILYFGYVKSPG